MPEAAEAPVVEAAAPPVQASPVPPAAEPEAQKVDVSAYERQIQELQSKLKETTQAAEKAQTAEERIAQLEATIERQEAIRQYNDRRNSMSALIEQGIATKESVNAVFGSQESYDSYNNLSGVDAITKFLSDHGKSFAPVDSTPLDSGASKPVYGEGKAGEVDLVSQWKAWAGMADS